MSDAENISMEDLGEFVGEDAPVPVSDEFVENAEVESVDTSVVSEFENPQDDVSVDDEMTLEELDSRIQSNLKAVIEEYAKNADSETADLEMDPEVLSVVKQNRELEKRLAELEQQTQRYEEQELVQEIEHSIASTAGKYKMTSDEVQQTTEYLLANPDLAKVKSWEWAATRVFPELVNRLNDAPTGQHRREIASGEGFVVPPTASGAGAPSQWRHTPNRGDYSDVTQHILLSGIAANLGRFE